MKDKLRILFFTIAVIALFVGGFALASVQNAHDQINAIEIPETFDWRTDKAFWKFVNDNYISEQELNQTTDSIEAEFSLFQNEIVKIKTDIKSKFPQASQVIDEQQSVIASTPFLTLKMDRIEFLLGEKITFRGVADSNHAVLITIKKADRTLDPIAVSKNDIVNGQYVIEYQTKFDDTPGIWTAYARQLSDQTKTLTFKVE